MSIDPSVLGFSAGALAPAGFAISVPLTTAATVLAIVLLAALAVAFVSRLPLRRRAALHLRMVRP